MEAIVSVVIQSVLSGIILIAIKVGQHKAAKREEDRDEREELTLESLNAINCVNKELFECTLHKKTPNGDLEAAFQYQQDVKHKLESYMRRRASKA